MDKSRSGNFTKKTGTKIKVSAEIHLIHGFMGFGKTTLAKQLEQSLPAVRFTHDEIMFTRYGRTPDNFAKCCEEVTQYIKDEAQKAINNGHNIILDFGFWDIKTRQEYYLWAKSLTDNVYFHTLICDIEVAKTRVLNRTQNNPNELYIDEACFNDRLTQFTPLTDSEGYNIIYHYTD